LLKFFDFFSFTFKTDCGIISCIWRSIPNRELLQGGNQRGEKMKRAVLTAILAILPEKKSGTYGKKKLDGDL